MKNLATTLISICALAAATVACRNDSDSRKQAPQTPPPPVAQPENPGTPAALVNGDGEKIVDEGNLLECYKFSTFKSKCTLAEKPLETISSCSKVVISYSFNCGQPWTEFTFALGNQKHKVYETDGLGKLVMVGSGDLTLKDLQPKLTNSQVFDLACRLEISAVTKTAIADDICSAE